ncbi:penicillin-binding transpeptidase domain-containing protein [Streptomyces sp. MBT53]|uniref:penicillin-binding transpeptidase domain-containing protein n=1 Tax=Streptomyces sp. MBT53 TaxID=1488384 RepID=UPI0019123B14|nr:penicillin-binding transpeptidase domain-containing protein [Streptomyces sp. MBT53]MBK6012322.1 hypothetical protein [Streptomyces sp. MBT53]
MFKPFALAAIVDGERGPRPLHWPVTTPPPGIAAMQSALVTSAHAPFVQLGKSIGWVWIRNAAVRAGLLKSSMAPLEQTFPIGTSTPSAIRTADAYATFASSGKQNDPYSVTGVLRHGEPVPGLQHPDARTAFTPGVAAIVDRVLQGVASRNGSQKIVPGSASVATGADDLTKSAWFVGCTKDQSTAITLFRNKPGEAPLLSLKDTGGRARFMGYDGDFALNRR